MEHWFLIGPAARDGTLVLLAVAGRPSARYTGYWRDGEWWLGQRPLPRLYQAPTHWTPLPAPPADVACHSKRTFRTEDAARAAVRDMKRRVADADRLHAYRCDRHHGWHVGNARGDGAP